MFRKCLPLVLIAVAASYVLNSANTAKALSYVDTGHPYYVTEYMVQYQCPDDGTFKDYQACYTGTQITNAIFELTGQGYTTRYIVSRTLTYYYVYSPQFPSLGHWELQN